MVLRFVEKNSSIGQRKFLLDRIKDPKVDGFGNILFGV